MNEIPVINKLEITLCIKKPRLDSCIVNEMVANSKIKASRLLFLLQWVKKVFLKCM